MSSKALQYKNKTKISFDKKSSNYDETYDGRYSSKMYQGVMDKLRMQPFESLLDVGCGTGTILSMVLREYKSAKISGIDISEEMLKKASAALGDSAELINGDSDNLPWKDNSFDVIVCNASFHHYPEPKKVLMEMRRVLKPNGRVIIADPWWPNPRRFFINLYLSSPFNSGGDVRIYSESELCSLLSQSGFKSIQWGTPEKSYGIICAIASKS